MSAANPTAPAEGSVPEKKRSKKLVALLLSGLLLACGTAGAAAWYLAKRGGADDPAAAAADTKSSRKPVFTPLEPFTVNLKDGDSDRFAQIAVTLQLDDTSTEMAVKDRLPAVRNNILLLIASHQAQELLTAEGKQKLADQIAVQAALALGVDVTPAAAAPGAAETSKQPKPVNPVKGVLFSHFIIQ